MHGKQLFQGLRIYFKAHFRNDGAWAHAGIDIQFISNNLRVFSVRSKVLEMKPTL